MCIRDREHAYSAESIIPFSSDRKWGAMTLTNLGTIYLGAPEMLLKENPPAVLEAQAHGSRVLILARSVEAIDMHDLTLPSDVEAIAVIEILDPIREGAAETLDYLRSQDVDLKIISGDNPVTVSYIAKEAGLDVYKRQLVKETPFLQSLHGLDGLLDQRHPINELEKLEVQKDL